MAERTIVNFTVADEGTGTLSRAVPRVDPSMEGAQQWDVDLTFGVDEGQADHVAPAVPDAGEYLARARDGKASATITVKPAQRDIRLNMHTTGEEVSAVLLNAGAEVRQIKLALTEKAQAYTARLRLYGMTPEQGGALLRCLGKPVSIKVVPAQVEMDFGEGAPIGAVVSAHDGMEDVFGVLQQKRGEQYVIDDFGVLHTVNAINAALEVPLSQIHRADEYGRQVRDAGGVPTWRTLVAAMAQVCDAGAPELTGDVVQAAVEAHLPAEAGANG